MQYTHSIFILALRTIAATAAGIASPTPGSTTTQYNCSSMEAQSDHGTYITNPSIPESGLMEDQNCNSSSATTSNSGTLTSQTTTSCLGFQHQDVLPPDLQAEPLENATEFYLCVENSSDLSENSAACSPGPGQGLICAVLSTSGSGDINMGPLPFFAEIEVFGAGVSTPPTCTTPINGDCSVAADAIEDIYGGQLQCQTAKTEGQSVPTLLVATAWSQACFSP